jgi:hypothetical protein
MLYRIADRLSFKPGAPVHGYLTSGWSDPDRNHCWTVGHEAEIRFDVQGPDQEGFVLRIECAPFLGNGAIPHQIVEMLVNDTSVATWTVREMGWYEAPIPAAILTLGQSRIVFRIVDPISPAACQLSGDTRLLGLNVRTLEILPDETLCPDIDAPSVEWRGGGFDPIGDVFVKGGRYFRAIKHAATARVRELIDLGVYQSLADRKLIPEHSFWEISHPKYSMIARTSRGTFVASSSYPLLAFQAAARVWLDINDALLDLDGDYGLIDGHSGNFAMFKNSRPMWVDTGSIGIPGDDSGDLQFGLDQFTRCYVYPLLMIGRQPQAVAEIRKLLFNQPDGITKSQFETIVAEGLELDTLEKPSNKAERRTTLRRLRDAVESVDFHNVKGFWSGYRRADQLEWALHGGPLAPEVDARFRAVVALVQRSAARTFIDLGANDGLFSLLCVREGPTGIAVDLDDFSINKLYQFLTERPDVNLVVAHGAFLDAPYMAELVMALALTHHLNLSQGLTFRQIAESLARRTSHSAITEFMPFGLGGTADTADTIPNPLPIGYSIDSFVEALQANFRHVEVVDYDRPNVIQARTLIYCEGPRGA